MAKTNDQTKENVLGKRKEKIIGEETRKGDPKAA